MWHPAINFKNLASRLQDKSRCRQNIFIMHPAILSLVIPYPATPSLSRFHPLCIPPSTPALQVAYMYSPIRISNIRLQSYNSKNRNMLTGHYWAPYIWLKRQIINLHSPSFEIYLYIYYSRKKKTTEYVYYFNKTHFSYS